MDSTRFHIVMGVTGCGKTTIGKAVAAHMSGTYLEGDALHPVCNISKMSSGIPLTDEDRWPWLRKIGAKMTKTDGLVFAGCSALKRSYREVLERAVGSPIVFIHLDGRKDLIAARMNARKGHFMPPELLDSQFATLEPPQTPENVIRVDISGTQGEITSTIVSQLRNETDRKFG